MNLGVVRIMAAAVTLAALPMLSADALGQPDQSGHDPVLVVHSHGVLPLQVVRGPSSSASSDRRTRLRRDRTPSDRPRHRPTEGSTRGPHDQRQR